MRRALLRDLKASSGSGGYSHILVFIMGWNTVQAEAVRNFNSMIGHLLDEVEARRKTIKCKGQAEDVRPVCRFKPLFVGVT